MLGFAQLELSTYVTWNDEAVARALRLDSPRKMRHPCILELAMAEEGRLWTILHGLTVAERV